MKFLKFAVPVLALGALLFTGCSDDDNGNGPSGNTPSVGIEFVALRSPAGTYELGVEVNPSDNATKVDIFVDDATAPSATLTAEPWETFIGIDDPGNDLHKVRAVAYTADGTPSAEAIEEFSKNMRTVLAEIITSANCVGCAPANKQFKVATGGAVAQLRIATIKYHVWWPLPTDSLYHLTKTWSKPRTEYLFSPKAPDAIPNAFINGNNLGATANNWVLQTEALLDNPPQAIIKLEKTDNGSTVDLDIELTGIVSANYGDLRLHTVVTESEIYYNDGNEEEVHYEVMKEMMPGYEGEAISLGNDETKSFQRTIPINPGSVKSNMQVVVFIQSAGSKDILNAAVINL